MTKDEFKSATAPLKEGQRIRITVRTGHFEGEAAEHIGRYHQPRYESMVLECSVDDRRVLRTSYSRIVSIEEV